jgi:hypothetical protein
MKTVNSLSGGKTSSYIAVNYPADIEIFALVCIDDHNAGRSIDKAMKQRVNDKLQKFCPGQPEFRATSEDPKILKVMFDLEQMIGREIVWVRGMGWEKMIGLKKAIPNQAKRFCTSILKMQPIFDYLYLNTELPVEMRIGYRYDEQERRGNFGTTYSYPNRSEYQPKSNRWIQRWEEIEWRTGSFPLIDDKIFHYQIHQFWQGKQLDFPEDSNCLNCFWKQPAQLRKNFNTDNAIMQWSKIQEDLQGKTFKEKLTLAQIERLPIQYDFIYGTGSGCTAGFCTD